MLSRANKDKIYKSKGTTNNALKVQFSDVTEYRPILLLTYLLSARVPGCQKLQMAAYPGLVQVHSCNQMAAMSVRGLKQITQVMTVDKHHYLYRPIC